MLIRTTWLLAAALALIFVPRPASAADEPKPLKVLLITGGCCHDYAKQKDILKKGIEARANSVVPCLSAFFSTTATGGSARMLSDG